MTDTKNIVSEIQKEVGETRSLRVSLLERGKKGGLLTFEEEAELRQLKREELGLE